MRKTFEDQIAIGAVPIEDTKIFVNNRHASTKIFMALLELYKNVEFRNKVLEILENKITKPKKKTGRKGMNLWQIFVLSQVRLGLNLSYDELHEMANTHDTLRGLMGVKTLEQLNFEEREIRYQNILDNVGLLSDEEVREINDVIVEFGNKEIFKKKEEADCILKTDSFVVKSNVHFPTDYNLLWDCMRKSLDMVEKIMANSSQIIGWRKLKDWKKRIKTASRQVGQINSKGGVNKAERLEKSVSIYLEITNSLTSKIEEFIPHIPLGEDNTNWIYMIELQKYVTLTKKHIDLLERRVIKKETIPHEEKMFSIFETYTEWINKGKPQIELGKRVSITTDENNLIIDYIIHEREMDSETVVELIDRIVKKNKITNPYEIGGKKIKSWSFDKGYYSKENKHKLKEVVQQTIMPKKGKKNVEEKQEESVTGYKRLRNRHSAVESNINELGHRGLDRCPDRGYDHFKRYVGLGVSAYNLHKFGTKLWHQKMEDQKAEREKERRLPKVA